MADERQETSGRIDAQSGSVLFQRVPQEIRDKIYAQLFSTRITFGARRISSKNNVWIKPVPNGLAILRVCRRTRLEIGDSWLYRVLFCYEDHYTMLNRLTALPRDTLSKIRHLRVSGARLVYMIWGGGEEYYYLAGMLKLLPGLQLDQLTVIGTPDSSVNNDTLLGLLRDSAGWKTLRFIHPNSRLLGFPPVQPEGSPAMSDELAGKYRIRRKNQHLWQEVLEYRDGKDSSPSAAVYRSRKLGDHHCMLDPDRRINWDEELFNKGEGDPPGVYLDQEGEKEAMYIAERGTGVDYEEKEDSPFIKLDPRRHPSKRIWPKMEKVVGCIWVERKVDDGDGMVDVYKDVDEYAWPFYDRCSCLSSTT